MSGGGPQIVPYLYYEDATAAFEFLQRAFGFEVEFAARHPEDGSVLHATLCTGAGKVMIGPGMDAFGTRGPTDPDFTSAMIYVYVDDVDAHCERALAEGALLRAELHEHFGGNRQYTVSDPGGQRWTFAQPIEAAGA